MFIIQSLIVPLRLILNDRKGKNIILIILVILFGIIYIASLSSFSYIYVYFFNLQTFFEMMFGTSIQVVIALLTIVSLIILCLSMRISMMIFNKKEF